MFLVFEVTPGWGIIRDHMTVCLNCSPWSCWWDRAGPPLFTHRVRCSSPVSGTNKCNLYWWHLGPGKAQGVSDPWSFSQDTHFYKMGKPFQIRNIRPLRGKEKVLLWGATLKSFLRRQTPLVSFREGTCPPVSLLHVWQFLQAWYPRILQREFCTSAKTFPRIPETCQGVTCVKKSS